MKLVELTTEMRPWGVGDKAALPDALADKLLASGEATLAADQGGLKPDGHAAHAAARTGYLTRAKGKK